MISTDCGMTARIASISRGEQTIDVAPAAVATRAIDTAVSRAGLAYPRSERSASARDVRTVTAVIDVDVTAETAALIIAAPPLAWTVRKRGWR